MSWKIFGQPSRKKRGLFGLWRRRRTKEEEKSIGEQKRGGGRKQNIERYQGAFQILFWIVFTRWVFPIPICLFLCPKKLLNWGILPPPPLQRKTAKQYYDRPEFAKIYPNYSYAHDMNRMKDETGNIMMLNLENAENVCFGFVNHDQSASKYDQKVKVHFKYV